MISEAVSRSPFLLGQILDWPAALYPERAALEWEGGALTFAELQAAVRRRRERLAACGVGPRERWGLLLGNSPDLVVSLLALAGLGCVAVPLRSGLPWEKLSSHVRLTRLDGILTSETTQDRLAELGFDRLAGWDEAGLRALCSRRASPREAEAFPLVDLDPALILLTSGSSGQPRAAVLEHHAILANLRGNVVSLGLRDDDRTLVLLPLTHAYALVHQCLAHLLIGATVCLAPGVPVGGLLHRYLESSRATTLSTVPPLLRSLVAGLKRSRCALADLRLITVGAAFADRLSVNECLALLPHVRLAITYGLTEAGPRVATHFVAPGEPFTPERVGAPLPNVAVGLRPLADGRQEIVLRTRSAMRGYLDELEARSAVTVLSTGDTGELRAGEIFLRGRMGRSINRGGILVGAEQIESALLAHPAVAAARVEAEEHPFWGSVPVATVTPAPGAEVDEQALRAHCAACLSPEERPFRFVIRPAGASFVPSKTQALAAPLP